jgi:pimeloyl-ACP methyl ester carboxylesterase
MRRHTRAARRLFGTRSRPVFIIIALLGFGALLTASVNTLLEHQRNDLALAPDGSRMLGILVASREPDAQHVIWQRLKQDETPQRIVILVHGLDEPGNIWDDLTPALLDEGHAVVRFEYPNDQAIDASADFFAEHLRTLRTNGTLHADIVCHSMGGLVSRDTLTRKAFYADNPDDYPNIEHLITVGTPNHGSPLAPLQPISEVRELLVRWALSFGDAQLSGSSLGDAQAARDLAPGSDFLNQLNTRPFPQKITYTIIAGKLVPLDANAARTVLDDPTIRAILPASNRDAIVSQLNALAKGVGDGVVPLDSAMLEGINDVVILNTNHRSMLKRSALAHTALEAVDATLSYAPAIPIIINRLHHDQHDTPSE